MPCYLNMCSVNKKVPSQHTPPREFRSLRDESSPSPLHSSTETLDMSPGDVLFVRGVGGLTDIGTTGGYFGHFLVVVSSPENLSAKEAHELREEGMVASRAWKVETIESTRNHSGLHRSYHVVYAEPRTGRLSLAAELLRKRDGLRVVPLEKEPLQVWRSPLEARHKVTLAAIRQVLSEMKACEQNWSLATAARAVLMPASVLGRRQDHMLLLELCTCWEQAPICTSIVVIFWQRLLGVMASQLRRSHIDLILQWLPLKADRGLPGELVTVLETCGWVLKEHL